MAYGVQYAAHCAHVCAGVLIAYYELDVGVSAMRSPALTLALALPLAVLFGTLLRIRAHTKKQHARAQRTHGNRSRFSRLVAAACVRALALQPETNKHTRTDEQILTLRTIVPTTTYYTR